MLIMQVTPSKPETVSLAASWDWEAFRKMGWQKLR